MGQQIVDQRGDIDEELEKWQGSLKYAAEHAFRATAKRPKKQWITPLAWDVVQHIACWRKVLRQWNSTARLSAMAC
eukprot:6999990-Karenia_brevis.AAC.1